MSYYTDIPGEWRPILAGQQTVTNGAHRWEGVNLNGFAVFNNGRDLPVTYRIGDTDAVPIYELREQGVAAVGTICEHSGILLVMDIKEIQADKLADLFRLKGIVSSGQLTATQAGNTVTASDEIFTSAHVGLRIVYADGTVRVITGYTSATVVTVDGAALTFTTPQAFELKASATQAGATHSGLLTGAMASGDATVTASGDIFTAGMVGRWVWFQNGWHRKITAFTDAQHVELSAAPTFDIVAQPFFVVDDATDYTVTASADIFTADMVGLSILWPDGTTRKITAYVNATAVTVDMYVAVGAGLIGIENDETYAAYTRDEFVNRIGYKIICSMPALPRRWAAQGLGSIQAGSRWLTLKYPMKSLEAGQQIEITGAGLEGGNHTSTILYAHALGTKFLLSTAVNTTVSEAIVIRSDAVNSIVGSFELQDDGSRIMRAKDCRGELVIYKETAIFLGQYTGLVDQPFGFKKLSIPSGSTLYYPWTLIEVEGLWHFYAGRNGFYRFDMTTQLPVRIPITEVCSDIFFANVDQTRKEEIFTADNWLTHEIFLCFPTTAADTVRPPYEVRCNDVTMCFDYLQATVSTSAAEYTAAGMIKRPYEEGSYDWFIMGQCDGTVLLYGMMECAWPIWAGRKQIFFRRGTNPYSSALADYISTLQSGFSDIGDKYNEKILRAILIILASQEVELEPLTLIVDILGVRNTSEAGILLGSQTLVGPKSENLVPTFYCQHYFADRLRAFGNVPCRLSQRLWEVSGRQSKSITRRRE